MAGHSHWKQIKVQKGSADAKRAKVFSKLLAAVAVAAKGEANPQFNPRLRTAIAKAKENQVPQENIERAIKKASEKNENLEEVRIECYGPGGAAIIAEAITSNSNRTINEVRLILKEFEGKLGGPGSATWAFEPAGNDGGLKPKFAKEINDEDRKKLSVLIEVLENQDDVQRVYTNVPRPNK